VQAGMGLAITLRYTGDLLSKMGRTTEALTNYEKVLGLLDRLSLAQPDDVLVQGRRAEMLIYLASELAPLGRLEEARKKTEEGLGLTRKLAARPDVTADDLLAYAWSFLNCEPADLREPVTAVEYAQRAVQKLGGKDPAALDFLARARNAARREH